ncbi:mitochondrial carrier [Nadsonia fulvescens var. elongata DSM 6958]|uniref:Mitochondrial carrier n=1 Tax=Nadsonia fulvescens var. elongata DSM 6958 TaxID=857566 RepID=A0A1E3PS92_9ASCO|nr:mitochondrial carrier [Nadsonia fulvescens var. elongata DSM 6958]
MAGALFTCPLDVVKTRLQSDFYKNHVIMSNNYSALSPARKAIAHFSDTIQILRSVYKQEGSRALFKGLGPNLVGVIPARSINFFTYGVGKEFISSRFNNGQESTWVHLLAAINAGFFTSTATNPIWLIKTRLQLDKSEGGVKQYKNSLDCLVKVIKAEGAKGLYKGLSASYLGSAESTIQWVLYEQMKSFIRQKEIARQQAGVKASAVDKFFEWAAQSGAAGMAKLLASMITYPHEVVRTRLRQAPLGDGKPKYTGLIQCFRLVIAEEGFWSMYGGLTPHLLRTVPNSIIMFGTFELIVKLFS